MIGLALYATHHVGDYWVQTDHQAGCKGKPGADGRLACTAHVLSYLATQVAGVGLAVWALDIPVSLWGLVLGLLVSGATHYMADRRDHGLMFWIARKLGKSGFMRLGVPRVAWATVSLELDGAPVKVRLDNPSLGTGSWALDQSWHIFWGVFVTAIIMAVV
jgi:hypothetical protein